MLLGPSGCGKSTLLNILGGLDVPTRGDVVYRDHDLTAAGEAALTRYRREHVGFVFQFYNLIPSLTARENVALVTEIADASDDPERGARRWSASAQRLDHFPAQLSGGEQQRVAIARAIAKRPDVLLCDEPTGALDITTGIVVLEAIERVNRELGTTTVVITHNAAIAGMADRVVRLADGRIAGVERNATKLTVTELAMVRMAALVPVLDRKLLRDLWEMKGQALAIAAVIACRRGDVRHVPVELRLAAADARRVLRDARGSPTCSRRSNARPPSLEPRIAAIPGVDGGRDARRRGRDARRPGTGRAGGRPADFGAGARTAAAERRVPAPRPLGRPDAS